MTFLLYRNGNLAVLFGAYGTSDGESDIEQPLRLDDMIDGTRVLDWPMGLTEVDDATGRAVLQTIAQKEQTPPPKPSKTAPVAYDRNNVIAYFDAMGKATAPHFATTAKVWTKDGKIRIIDLTHGGAHDAST